MVKTSYHNEISNKPNNNEQVNLKQSINQSKFNFIQLPEIPEIEIK